MWPIDNIRIWYSRRRAQPPNNGAVEKDFGVVPAVSRVMQDNINLWYALYLNEPPWVTPESCVKPLGLAGAIGRELARYALAEFSFTVSGGTRADYINERMQLAAGNFLQALELGLCLGGVAFRPYIERGQLYVDVTGATAFSPIEFDGGGRCISGVFRDTITYRKQKYTRLEYHGFEDIAIDRDAYINRYVIRNKAYRGDTGGGAPIKLSEIPAWAELDEETVIEHVERPLFSYFKNPSSNSIDPESQVGVSVYGGAPNIALLQQADEQWERLNWEFKSGERKIFSDATKVKSDQFHDRLFEYGRFTADGTLFETFSPEFRNEPLYQGLQKILQRIEYNVGLSFGDLSDPQSVEKTATEILTAKNRKRTTLKHIQDAFKVAALDDLAYAINVYCDLYGLAPRGEYEINCTFGDTVLDDPETIRQNKAMFLQEITAGVRNPWEYRVEYLKETPEEAMAKLPGMEDLMRGVEQQEEVE